MRHNKYLLAMYLLLGVALLSVANAEGSVTVVAPSGTVAGTAVLNATGTSILNCTFYAKSASTANSTWTAIGTFVNGTSLGVNGTYATGGLEDSNDYIFNATCRNSTNSIHDGVSSAVTIDNTVPQAPNSLSPATNTLVTSAGAQTFTTTVVDRNTTGCTYVIGRGGITAGDATSGTATYATTSCSFTKTFSTQTDNGLWYWKVTATDGTNTTGSTINTMNVQIAPAGGSLPGDGGDTDGTSTPVIWYIVIAVGIGLIVWWIIKK
jgi:hypothetical protein